MKNLIKAILFPFVFLVGYCSFLLTKRTNNLAYASFRYLFVLTNGRLNNCISFFISITNPYKKENNTESLLVPNTKVSEIVKNINENGYSEFETNLSDEIVEKLIEFANTTEANILDTNAKGVKYLSQKSKIDFLNICSPRYQFEGKELANTPAVQSIIFDPIFTEIAGNYLKCQPILELVTMWWSFPFNNQATSQAAQMYHFDMDRIKFLKFFFYLTDVHEENGPHCYIKKSHIGLSSSVRKDRRLSDDELKNIFPTDSFKEFTGKKGTILAVDTRGLHKGKPLVKDARLLFQIQFSNSLFGAPYEKMKIEKQEIIPIKNRTFQLFK